MFEEEVVQCVLDIYDVALLLYLYKTGGAAKKQRIQRVNKKNAVHLLASKMQ